MTDLCLLNGAFYTQDSDRPRAMAAAIRQGRFVALGSDCPVADPNPLWGFTLRPALVTGQDAELGSITPGKLADLVVLDRDILAAEPPKIAEAQAVMKVLGGAVVYCR